MNEPILLVEDEEHNVIFMELALQQAKVNNRLAVAKDGREAIAYLKGEGKFGNRPEYPLPGLVLLDLRLPQIPGLEVLEWIRGQTALKDVPVIVLSSSNQDQDVATAYRLGARAYVIKPAYPQLVELYAVSSGTGSRWTRRRQTATTGCPSPSPPPRKTHDASDASASARGGSRSMETEAHETPMQRAPRSELESAVPGRPHRGVSRRDTWHQGRGGSMD